MAKGNSPWQQAPQSGRDRPAMEYAAYPVKIAIWQNQKRTEGGREYTEYSCSLTKSFKREGSKQYEEQKITCFPEDLLRIRAVVDEAIRHTVITARVPQ